MEQKHAHIVAKLRAVADAIEQGKWLLEVYRRKVGRTIQAPHLFEWHRFADADFEYRPIAPYEESVRPRQNVRAFTPHEAQSMLGHFVRRRETVFRVLAVEPNGVVRLHNDAGPMPHYTVDLELLATCFDHLDGSPCGIVIPD